jgi:uncharacterized protein
MTVEGTIDYEALAQDAMRGVVRAVLERTAKSGLPGEHHFYISFDTLAPGAVLSKRLREKYPGEMTIVLQHRFWDLVVNEDRFEVKLTFDGIPERLVIPFQSIKVFFDPSVRYGLQFEGPDDGAQSALDAPNTPKSAPLGVAGLIAVPGPGDALRLRPGEADLPSASEQADGEIAPEERERDKAGETAKSHDDGESDEVDTGSSSAEIVSLDAFRKK